MEKEQYRESRQGLKISHLCFGIPSSFQIQKQSQIQCVNKTLYDDTISSKKNKSAAYGVLDHRLGE